MQTLLYPDPRLKRPTIEVVDFNDRLKNFAEDLFMYCCGENGLGMAAPQVDSPLRLIVVNNTSSRIPQKYPRYLVNPVIENPRGKVKFKEGCLSVPGINAWVERYSEFFLKYQTLEGHWEFIDIKENEDEAHLFKIVVQHEIDHLNGIEFIERLSAWEFGKIVGRLNKLRPRK